MQAAVDLFEKYYEDSMLLDDILKLFTALGKIPDNQSFVAVAIPKAFQTLQKYHHFTTVAINVQEASSSSTLDYFST